MDPNSYFVYCTFPTYEGKKLRGNDERICIISVLGDPGTVFFDNGFCIDDEEKSPMTLRKSLTKEIWYETSPK